MSGEQVGEREPWNSSRESRDSGKSESHDVK